MLNIQIVDTYQATIALGLKEGYTGKQHSVDEVIEVCQDFCNSNGLCITVTPTNFVYTDGKENGCLIGLINYPRFPSSNEKIYTTALVLASKLLVVFHQNRVSIICSDKTHMLENTDSTKI